MLKTPVAWYEARVQTGKLINDPYQRQIVLQFDKLYRELVAQERFFPRFKSACYLRLKIKQKPVRGIYLWGSVGRGKTFLMDMLFHLLPTRHKVRYHFHRFMQYVHQELARVTGASDPLYLVAKSFKAKTSIIFFDEFYVTDIADAMILSELFHHLFSMGISLVATSNSKPEDLYPNGLQREKFLPAIAMINQFTNVIAMDGSTDYRMQYLASAQLYQYPANELAEKKLMDHFLGLAGNEGINNQSIRIVDRMIATKWLAENIVWFEFKELCEGPRSTLDYIQIARDFKTVLLSHVVSMGENNEDVARRFIALIDELYDHKVTLIISANEPMTSLYQGKRHANDFQRTLSRLTEMQSVEYLQKRHLP